MNTRLIYKYGIGTGLALISYFVIMKLVVFLNQITYTRFIRKERLERSDMGEHLSPELRIHFVMFYNSYI